MVPAARINEMQTGGFLRYIFGPDASVSDKLQHLSTSPESVSGQEMSDLLRSAIDYGQVSHEEWNTIYGWAKDNYSKMSPEAKELFAKVDETIQNKGLFLASRGTPVLSGDELAKILADFEKPATQASPPDAAPAATSNRPAAAPVHNKDASAEAAIERLINKQGAIGGRDLMEAIRQGTADLDSQAAGAEFAQFAAFQQTEGARFHGSANNVMAIYERYARTAQDSGQTGIAESDWKAMLAEMEAEVTGTPVPGAPGTTEPATANLPAKSTGATAEGSATTTKAPAKGTKAASGSAPASGGNEVAVLLGEAGTQVKSLVDQIANLDPESPTYQKDLAVLQQRLYDAKERVQLLSQMLKALHEMSMSVIQNIR